MGRLPPTMLTRRSQSARSRGVSLLPRFARETTHAASYWETVGQQVPSQRSIAGTGSLPRRQGLRSRRAKSPRGGGGARRGSEATFSDGGRFSFAAKAAALGSE